jgi:hypothetical protein
MQECIMLKLHSLALQITVVAYLPLEATLQIYQSVHAKK